MDQAWLLSSTCMICDSGTCRPFEDISLTDVARGYTYLTCAAEVAWL